MRLEPSKQKADFRIQITKKNNLAKDIDSILYLYLYLVTRVLFQKTEEKSTGKKGIPNGEDGITFATQTKPSKQVDFLACGE